MRIALLLLLCMGLAWGQSGVATLANGDLSVEAEGMGRNSAEAMLGAKRAAVERGIGTFIHSETEVKNFMVNKDVVITKTVGSVKSADVLSETTGPDGAVTIKIRAVVSSTGIHDNLAALRILLESMEKPRVMVLIKERNIDENAPSNAVETELLRYLSEKEFNLVDPAAVEQLKEQEKTLKAATGDAAAAAALGAEAGAEMIIIGTGTAKVAEGVSAQLGGMKSCQADVSIKVIVCATAKVVTAKSEHAAVLHINPQTGGTMALTKASQKIMDQYIFEKVVGSWQDVINNGLPLRVMVSDVRDFKTSNAVIKGIQGAVSVVKVAKRGWNQTSGVLELEVTYKGNSDGFSETVDSFALPGGGKLQVTGGGQNSVRMKVAP